MDKIVIAIAFMVMGMTREDLYGELCYHVVSHHSVHSEWHFVRALSSMISFARDFKKLWDM